MIPLENQMVTHTSTPLTRRLGESSWPVTNVLGWQISRERWSSSQPNGRQRWTVGALNRLGEKGRTAQGRAGVRLLQHSNHDPVGRDSTTNHIRAVGGTTTTTDVAVRHYRRQPHGGPVRSDKWVVKLRISQLTWVKRVDQTATTQSTDTNSCWLKNWRRKKRKTKEKMRD